MRSKVECDLRARLLEATRRVKPARRSGSTLEQTETDMPIEKEISPGPIDWTVWEPTERACLCFICKEGRILLIQKKRGLGAGKVNGPGGRLEPGETALESAVRETREEILVEPLDLSLAGELFFDFVDGYKLHCAVFRAEDLRGEPGATDEADPFWAAIEAIPYEQMWADDRHWLPLLLERKMFEGRFRFDGETMLSHEMRILA